MSAQFFKSDTPQENQSIKVNDVECRGSLSCAEVLSCASGIDSAAVVSAKQFGQDGGTTHVQATSDSTAVDATGAGTSRLYQIETVNLTLAFGATTNFHVLLPTGALGTSPSYYNVVMSVYDYSGSYNTNGTPIAWIGSIDPTQNRVLIVIKNIAASQSLSGVLKFNLNIIQGGTT